MDGYLLQNKVLSVAISNPPPRRGRNEFQGGTFSDSSSKRDSSSKSEESSKGSDAPKSESSHSRGSGPFPKAGGSSYGP